MAHTTVDVDSVLAAVAGALEAAKAAGARPVSATDPIETGPAPAGFSRLCSLTGLRSGGAGSDAIAVLGSQAEVDAYVAAGAGTDLPLPGLLVVATGVDAAALPTGSRVVRVDDARLALARLSLLFDTRQPPARGRHRAAVIEQDARVDESASLAAGAVVEHGAEVAAGTVIGANSYLGRGSRLGADCIINANVTIYDGVRIGARVIIHSGAVIGADGFGYAASPTGAVKIRHAGGVVIGDDVEVGANTAIDRGTIDDTVIGARTKIDNLCQIGHNVTIGSDCLVAGSAAIGGSASIGNGVIIGGNVAISDHVTIGDGARVAGRSGVTKDIPAGETWAGFPARQYRSYVRSLYLNDRLEQMWQYVKRAKGDAP